MPWLYNKVSPLSYQVCYTARRANAYRQKDEKTKCVLPLQLYVHEIKAPIFQTNSVVTPPNLHDKLTDEDI